MATVTVRLIRTFHVEVDAEYGDTPESLLEKGRAALKANAKPDDETALLMPEGADK